MSVIKTDVQGLSNLSTLAGYHAPDAANLPATQPRSFDPDAWHAMQARDDQLIED